MKVTGLDGKEYSWTLASSNKSDSARSAPHLKAREVIKKIFPNARFYEDITLPGSGRNSVLYGDFYLPLHRIMIEVNGEQHSKFIPHFHKDKMNFYKGMSRDRRKIEWCELNSITLIALNYDETPEEWEEIINGR